ncbi:MAG: tail fiber protein [Calditrichaceae bacterium]|jgi:microcystin-dependent protein
MKKLLFIFLLLSSVQLFAQEGYIGEIRMFAGNFAPRDWALCDGQILSISQNSALYSIIGTTYGGNGTTSFALPDLRSRVPVQAGQGPGLSYYPLGQQGGVESVTLTTNQMPAHSHTAEVNADNSVGSSDSPENGLPARNAGATPQYGDTPNTTMNSESVQVGSTGGSQPHTNVQPYAVINFIICINGIYPPRD